MIVLYYIGALRKVGDMDEANKILRKFDDIYTSLDNRVHGVRLLLEKKYAEAIQCFEKCQDSFSHTCIGILTSNKYSTGDSAKSFEYLFGVILDRDGVWFRRRGRYVPGYDLFPRIEHHERDVQVAQYYLGRLYEFGYDVRGIRVNDPKEALKWYGKAAEHGNSAALHSLLRLMSKFDHTEAITCLFKGLAINKSLTELNLKSIPNQFINPRKSNWSRGDRTSLFGTPSQQNCDILESTEYIPSLFTV